MRVFCNEKSSALMAGNYAVTTYKLQLSVTFPSDTSISDCEAEQLGLSQLFCFSEFYVCPLYAFCLLLQYAGGE